MVGIHCLLRSARPALYSLGFAQPDREVPWFATGGSYLVLVSLVHKERGILGEGDFMSFGQGIIGPAFQSCYFSSKGKIKSKSDGGDSGEESLSKKELALQQAVDHITSSFGKGSIMWLGRSHAPKEVPVVSTGSLSLDIALGIGGFPKGRVVEIYGPEAAGKTTLALHVIAEAPKKGGYCAFVDADHALDPALARSIGVNTDNLLLSQPDSMEQALSLVDTLIRSGSVDVLVVDSVAALVPKSELDGEMGDAHMALQARLMSQALRKLTHPLSQSQTILLFINQIKAEHIWGIWWTYRSYHRWQCLEVLCICSP
ncbi:DNA repair protein recA [Canna indica]|uniref:DNA repair protein recA n=1 Tax=Canna indica TaxID=4628 RepID=A0AAQ3QGR9_9LILI|nr:DNA repair protein recA [Canna indica]